VADRISGRRPVDRVGPIAAQDGGAATAAGNGGRVYAGQRRRTVDDWVRLGWVPAQARQLVASASRDGGVLVMDGSGVRGLTHYAYHSPGGFAWGHSGCGSVDLARCILLDHYGVVPVRSGRLYRPVPGELPVRYEDFHADVIVRLPEGRDWSLTSAEIDAWAIRRGREPATASPGTP
jgi:hypothetical protein